MREKLLLVIISLVLFSFSAIGCEQKKETYTYIDDS